MDRYLEKLFATPDDFDLLNGLFMRIQRKCDGSVQASLRALPEAQRVVLMIWGAHSLVDNGGFEYLLAGDLTDFPWLANAYELIEMPHAAAAVRDVMAIFPNGEPQATVEERRRFMQGLEPPVEARMEASNHAVWKTSREMTRKLAAYARRCQQEFANLPPTKWENFEELSNKNLPPPPAHCGDAAVEAWLKSIGGRFARWSDISSHPRASDMTAPSDGDPILDVSLDKHRGTTDAEIAALVQYSASRQLRALDLDGTRISAAGVRQLAVLDHLDDLNLSRTNLDDSWTSIVAPFPALRSLDVSMTRLTDSGIASFATAPKLRCLKATSTDVTGAGFSSFPDSSPLEVLWLCRCPVTDAAAQSLSNLTPCRA